jgi:glucose/mannose transport system permease protein
MNVLRRSSGLDFVGLAALTIAALLFLMPVYVMVMAGLKSEAQADAAQMWELPEGLNAEGVRTAWGALGPNFGNSIATVVPATII